MATSTNKIMSIEMTKSSPDVAATKHKSKSSKKEKSSDGEKKRKRENAEEGHKKSKKHKGDKAENDGPHDTRHDREKDRIELDGNAEVIPDSQLSDTQSSNGQLRLLAPEDEVSQKSKKSKTKKVRSSQEKLDQAPSASAAVINHGGHIGQSSQANGDDGAIEPRKHKKHTDRNLENKRPGDETLEHKSKKSKEKSELETTIANPKRHKSLPDRTATSSPAPAPELSVKKTKHKKSKSSSKAPALPDQNSAFHTQTSSLYLPLSPVSQKHALEGLCAEHLSPLILTYYPPFSGVILSYSNPRFSETVFGNDGPKTLMKCIDEYAVSWAWVTADFLLFKPDKGVWLEGYVNLQNEGHLGVVCWNLFNASIERKRLPADWKWVGVEDEANVAVEGVNKTYAEDGIGYWVDNEGVKIGETVKFRVSEIETSHDKERGFLSIEGSMLDDEAENILLQQEAEAIKTSRDTAGRRLGGSRSIGATSLGVPVEPDLMATDKPKRKRY